MRLYLQPSAILSLNVFPQTPPFMLGCQLYSETLWVVQPVFSPSYPQVSTYAHHLTVGQVDTSQTPLLSLFFT